MLEFLVDKNLVLAHKVHSQKDNRQYYVNIYITQDQDIAAFRPLIDKIRVPCMQP